jgi:hypothetical protein
MKTRKVSEGLGDGDDCKVVEENMKPQLVFFVRWILKIGQHCLHKQQDKKLFLLYWSFYEYTIDLVEHRSLPLESQIESSH